MIAWLNEHTPFPPAHTALPAGSEAPGLLAASQALDAGRLLTAYRSGIFPWYAPGQPVLWWSPDPRMVLRTDALHISHSLRKRLRHCARDPDWSLQVDTDFRATMHACASARGAQTGTWITEAIIEAYCALHDLGWAHSVECHYRGQRVGGLYGVCIGHMFFGESMFASVTDASKMALCGLVSHLREQGVEMLDCQQETAHLARLGARPMAREAFLDHVQQATQAAALPVWPKRLPFLP